MNTFLARWLWISRLLGLLRIVAGLLFFEHGTAKIFGFPPGSGLYVGLNITSMLGISGILDSVGGTLMTAGLFTRVTAFILSGEMAVAYFTVHARHGFFPIANNGETTVLYCFLFLYFAAAGPGSWSVDALLYPSRSSK